MGGHAHDRAVGFKVDRLPDIMELGHTGEGNRWMFSSLKSATYNTYHFSAADEGKYAHYFEAASHVLRSPNGSESYYNQYRGNWYRIGQALLSKNTIEPTILNYKIPLKGCIPILHKATQVYGTNYKLRKQHEGLTEEFVVRENYKDVQDARGRLYLPQGIYDAYRVKREVSFETEINADEAPLELVDYTCYLYVDEVTNELLVNVRMDHADQIETVTYLAAEDDIPSRALVGKNQFTLYPSTSFGDIRLDFVNFEEGAYYFELYNIIGKKLWSKRYDITNDVTIKEDLSFLSKGTYLYTILDRHRNNIVTKRLAILNP